MSKLDNPYLCIDLNYMITKFHNQDEAKMDLDNFAKKFTSHEQSRKQDQNMSKWQGHTNFMLGQPF
jgi:hypothetical protein